MRHLEHPTKVVVLFVTSITLGTCGCALLSKAEIVDVRYFSPEHAKGQNGTQEGVVTPTNVSDGLLLVRLGRVTSGANLRERIAYRDAAYERGYYEDFRWTERPETYVRRELGRSLFEGHGVHRALHGEAPTLDVEVVAFDELRLKTGRAARVELHVILHGNRGVLYEDTVTIERTAQGEKRSIEPVVAALAAALDAVADRVALRVHDALAEDRLHTGTPLERYSGRAVVGVPSAAAPSAITSVVRR